MANQTNFNYLNRDFASLKEDLKSYIKIYYPDEYNDFSESSVGMMLLELNAYVGDILSYHVDKNFNEMFMDSAQNRDSVIRISKNLGYNPRGRKPSATLLDVSITVPTLGDTYNFNYLITLEPGMRASSVYGQTFEVLDEIDFDSHTSMNGTVNRTITPNYNSSNEIVNYTITKTVPAVAGISKSTYLEVTNDNAVPFMKWRIDDEDISITEIQNIISKDTRYTPESESEWTEAGPNTVWYNVDSLPQERVFIDTSLAGDGSEGAWQYIDNRFIYEYDDAGKLFITFGAGIKDHSNFAEFTANGMTNITMTSLLNNDSLGSIPQVGTYLHCRYRSGGGPSTNAAQNTITTVQKKVVSYVPGGASLPASTVSDVVASVSVTNPIPAIGGKEFETIDEMKSNARYHFSSQDRCVTVDDYISRVAQLPVGYGSVFRSYAQADETSMNTALYILTKDENGKLKNTGNEQLKYNIAAYLKPYKILNDFIKIYDGRIINLGVDFALQVRKDYNKQEAVLNAMNIIKNYFAIEKWQMNSSLYISQLSEILREQPGVVNVVSIQFYNKVGGDYSNDILAMDSEVNRLILASRLATDGQVPITPINNSIKAPLTGMFEIKYPEKDIRGSVIT